MKNNSKNDHIPLWMLALTITLAFSVFLDTQFRLVNTTLWYDTMLHILGGAWVSTIFIYQFYFKLRLFDDKKNFLFTLTIIIGFAALVGVGWELYEFMFDQTLGAKYLLPLSQPDLADTMKDLANDLLGGTIIAIIYYLR